MSWVTLQVERVLHGNVAAQLSFELPGGSADGITMIQDGVGVMQSGDRYLVMLYQSPNGPLKVLGAGVGAVRLDPDVTLQPQQDLVALYQSNCNGQ